MKPRSRDSHKVPGDGAAKTRPIISLKHIAKRFPGVVANRDVTIDFYPSEVHAILGENGAGKTTLMNIIAGLYQPDSGEILIEGKRVVLASPRDAAKFGIGMVHQHFTLVSSFTVTENIMLGLPKPRFWFNARRHNATVRELASRYAIDVNPEAPVWQLSVGEQQRVEILKLLYRGARILILDEPTAVLTPQEAARLFETLRNFVLEGRTVLFISHKLNEVLQLADRVSVLRRGNLTARELLAASQTADSLTQLMVGRSLNETPLKVTTPSQNRLLEINNLTALGDRFELRLAGITMNVHCGEIVGIAGVAGNGQREFVEVLTGLRSVKSGEIRYKGVNLVGRSVHQIHLLGIRNVPEQRQEVGTAVHLSVLDNTILTSFKDRRFNRYGILNFKAVKAHLGRLMTQFEITIPDIHAPASLLSGGNLQKLILARELAAEPGLFIAMYPTRGLDVGAAAKTYELMIARRNQGGAVLLVGEDLEELVLVCDRILVFYNGAIAGEAVSSEADVRVLGLMMMGGRKHDDPFALSS